MAWYYHDGKTQYGPVSDHDLVQLAKISAITPQTLVWKEGFTEWTPLHTACPDIGQKKEKPVFKTDADSPIPVPEGQHVCAISGKILPEDAMIRFGHLWVSKENKDEYLGYFLADNALPGSFRYAGFGIRALALTIDQCILLVPGILLFWGMGGWSEFLNMLNQMTSGVEYDPVSFQEKLSLCWSIIFFGVALYFIFFTGKYNATPGKMLCKIKVVKADGNPVGYGLSSLRYIASMISSSIFYLGYLSVFFDNQKRTLHDFLCNTRVVFKD